MISTRNYIGIAGTLCVCLAISNVAYFHMFGNGSQALHTIFNSPSSSELEFEDTSSTTIKVEIESASPVPGLRRQQTTGAAPFASNPILIENELPGTSDWFLTNPAMNNEVEGYMSRTSVQRGEAIMLYHNIINAIPTIKDQSTMVQIEVFRSGWYGGLGGRKVFGPVQVPGIVQTRIEPGEDGIIVCKWKDPYALQTQKDWTTGVYLVKLTNIINPEAMMQMQSYAIFVVRDDERPADIMFQLPTYTYQAYNIWGGKNLYRCNLNKNCQKAAKVSFDRPYAGPENTAAAFGTGAAEYFVNVQPLDYPIPTAASWNYNMVRWLERNHLDVSYITNADVHSRLPKLQKPKLFLTQGHDEYWSWTMRDHITAWRDAGVDLTFLGSNTAYWQIRFEDVDQASNDEEPRTVVCYRRAKADPDKSKY
jgi:hypothetical protein